MLRKLDDMTNPKILFNCSTNNIGGGVKNAVLFIIEALKSNDSIKWVFLISFGVRDLLLKYDITLDDRFFVFEKSPARNKLSREKLISLEKKIQPNLVFTMAGPAYVKFSSLHVLGLSSAYITHPDLSIFKFKRNFRDKVKLVIHIAFQIYHSTKADFFIFQTDEARNNFSKNVRIDINRTTVINNAFDSRLQDVLLKLRERNREEHDPIIIFCPGAAYDHKGFQFIPRIVGELLKLTGLPFQFIITLPESTLLNEINHQINQLKVNPFIRNVGPFKYSNVASLYSAADIVFVPSLLETFSATYLEAMSARKILVVADKGFARDACEDAAIYVNPGNALETAKTFAEILRDPTVFTYKIQLGEQILTRYGNQEQRYKKIINLLNSIHRENLQLNK